MAETVEISTVLKRRLRDGKEYNQLIPRVSCKTTPLGEGDTFFTVDRMKDWIEKYRFQTAKLALRLEGRTVEETVNNIYEFLYNHIQYTADGQLQQLRSPACTWMQRKEGVDCKSFSVFASSILLNLGLKHAIRQVRQPHFYPEEFTHVYVVVYKDQSNDQYPDNAPTFVLDATRHENVEVNYIEKVDLYMNKLKHVGLNAPQDERTARVIRNFESFCQFLISKGMPVSQVNDIRSGIAKYTTRGIDPRINVVYDGVQVEGTIYPVNLTEPVPFLAVQKAFYGDKTPGLNGPGLGFSFSDAFESFSGSVQNTNTSGSGDVTGGIVDAGVTLAAGAVPFGNIIKGIMDKLEIGKNIANVLKYGLSSWGASTTPEETKKRFGEIVYPWLQQELAKTTIDNLGYQMTVIDANLRANAHFRQKLIENHTKAKSTRLAHEWARDECSRLLKEVMDGFSQELQKTGTRVYRETVSGKSSKLNPYPIMNFQDKHDLKKDRYWNEIDYIIYTVDKSTLKSWNNNQIKVNTGSGSSSQSNQVPATNTDTMQTFQPTVQEQGVGGGTSGKSSNTMLIAGGIALAGLLFVPMISGGSKAVKAQAPAAKKPAARKPKTQKSKK